MKKKLVLIAVMLFTFGIAEISYAAFYEINNEVTFSSSGTSPSGALLGSSGTVNYISGYGDYVEWKHLFTFSPPLGTIVDAQLTLSLRDDSTSDNAEYSWVWREGLGWTDDFEVNTSAYNFSVALGSLTDGRYDAEIYGAGGDFYIDKSKLWIKYSAVPEPMSLLLLGLGILGIGAVRRKK